jgi:hypothetical protein
MIAQAILAILLASAMAATFVGRRANNAVSQGRAWQRRQIPEPLVVGDPNVQVHHSGALRSSVDGLAGNYTPDAAPRVLHIALTTRDQVNMGVTNGLSGYVAVVDADVETTHRTIPVH